MSSDQKIDLLIAKLIASASHAERRAKASDDGLIKVNQLSSQFNQTMASAAQNIQGITSQTLSNALQTPTEEFDHNIKSITNKLRTATHEMNESIEQAHKKFNRIILLSLGTFVVAGVTVFGAWFYMYKQLDNKIERTDWISGINAAVATGKLTTCPDNGVCALVNNKLVRLDK